NATNDHALRDFCADLPAYSDMTFGNTGFRFVRLDFTGSAKLKCAVAVNHILRRREIYRYTGEDEGVRRIYETAKRTVDLCAAGKYLWDGVKRDRLVWVGDVHPEMLALTTLYGRLPLIERSLDFVKEQTPLPGWMNGFPAYSLWWIVIVADYCERTGAVSFARRQLGYLNRLLKQINGCVSENGEMDFPLFFLDWPTYETPDAERGVRAIGLTAAKKAVALLRRFGRDTSVAEELAKKLSAREIGRTESKAVLGLKYFAGELTEEDRALLTRDGARGISPFMSYYVLKAIASFDRERAIRTMKEFYGGMLDKGATTFWEDYNPEWAEKSGRIDEFPQEGQKDIHGDFGAYCYKGFRHSLCHGWSAGVLAFIKEECE
ncbi:MAG: alpha-L-rhamnosidase, partial [Candidatus Gallimonas sp.]